MSLAADISKQMDKIIALAGSDAEIIALAEQTKRLLAGDRLLTTGEARDLIGVRSVNTVKSMARDGDMRFELRNGRMLIPLSEVERVMDTETARRMRRLEAMHEATAELGHEGPLTEADHDDLDTDAARLPWQR